MKVWLEIQRTAGIDRREVKGGESFGVAQGKCPACGAEPFQVQGNGTHRMPDDRTLRAGGRCRNCSEAVGYIYARPNTIFGLEEDERVLHGRCRVYG